MLAQSLYVRLLNLVDDYGRFDGRPSVILGEAFSVWNDQNPAEQVDANSVRAACQQLARSLLAEFYRVPDTGKVFLQLTNWNERVRSKSKWPEPSVCAQLDSNLTAGCATPSVLAIVHRSSPSEPAPAPSADSDSEPAETAKASGLDFSPPTIPQFMAAWNCLPEGFQRVLSIAGERAKHFKARCGESFWVLNWQAAIDRMAKSAFLSGGGTRNGDHKAWRPTVEWFLRADTVVKIIEGKYDDTQEHAAAATTFFDSPAPQTTPQDLLANLMAKKQAAADAIANGTVEDITHLDRKGY